MTLYCTNFIDISYNVSCTFICIYNYSEVKFPQHVVCEPCGGNVLGGYDPKSKQVLYLKGLKCQSMFSLFNCLFSDCPL